MNNRQNQLNVFYNMSRFLAFHDQEYDYPTQVSLTTVLKYPREGFLRQWWRKIESYGKPFYTMSFP